MTDDSYRRFFEHLGDPAGFVRETEDGKDFEFIDVNEAAARFAELPREAFAGVRASTLFPGTVGLGILALGKEALRTGEAQRTPPLHYTDERIDRWVSVAANPLPTGEIAVLILDATKTHEAAVDLERWHQVESKMQRLTRSGYWRYTPSTGRLFWSPYVYELFGLDPADGPDYDAERARVHPEDRARRDLAEERFLSESGPHRYEFRVVVDDETKHVRAIAQGDTATDGERVFTGVFQDVTAEVEARQALVEREQRFRSVFDESPIGIHILDVQGNVLELNDAFADLYGLTPEMREAVLTKYNVFDDVQVIELGLRWYFERAFAGERVTTPIVRYDAAEALGDLDVDPADALTKWVRILLFPLREEDGPQRFTVGIVEDVTERYEAHLHDRRSRALFRSTADGVVITALDGTITDVNPAFTEITGWKPHEAIGRNPSILKSGEHDEAFYADMWGTLAETGMWRGEVTNRAKDGTEYRERLTITTIHDPDGVPEGYVGVFTQLGP